MTSAHDMPTCERCGQRVRLDRDQRWVDIGGSRTCPNDEPGTAPHTHQVEPW